MNVELETGSFRLDELADKLDDAPNLRGAEFVELEVSPWSGGFRFEGLAAVFDTPFEIPDLKFRESVEHGAFRKSLSSSGAVPMYYDHALKSDQVPLAVYRAGGAGTMTLSESPKGLAVVADVADTQLGRDVRTSAARGDIRGMSYGFRAGKGNSNYQRDRDGWIHRSVRSIAKLLDVSPTWNPAHPATAAEFRSLAYATSIVDRHDPIQQIFMGADEAQREDGEPELETADTESSRDQGDVAEHYPLRAARERELVILNLTMMED